MADMSILGSCSSGGVNRFAGSIKNRIKAVKAGKMTRQDALYASYRSGALCGRECDCELRNNLIWYIGNFLDSVEKIIKDPNIPCRELYEMASHRSGQEIEEEVIKSILVSTAYPQLRGNMNHRICTLGFNKALRIMYSGDSQTLVEYAQHVRRFRVGLMEFDKADI